MGLRIILLCSSFILLGSSDDIRQLSAMDLWQEAAMEISGPQAPPTCEDPEPPDWLGCSAPEAPEGLNIADPNLVMKPYYETEGQP